ncbi:MAG: hypothetical protein P4L36_17955 [Holophaga sp.]|nr:hypothetical protein [Holophaga sp.]
MKPKPPTETDLLALVQNGFNAQLPMDRAAQAPDAAPAPKPKADEADPSALVPMARITLTVPEELRYRLKLVLMNHRRTGRSRLTQDEYCAKAIGAQLDLEERGTDLRDQVAKVAEFLREGLRGKALTKGWDTKAQALLGELEKAGD